MLMLLKVAPCVVNSDLSNAIGFWHENYQTMDTPLQLELLVESHGAKLQKGIGCRRVILEVGPVKCGGKLPSVECWKLTGLSVKNQRFAFAAFGGLILYANSHLR